MNCYRKLMLTGYAVKYVDLREPKPRALHEEVYVVDGDTKESIEKLGLNLTDFVRDRYERGGYMCCSIERIRAKEAAAQNLKKLETQEIKQAVQRVEIDLRELWENAAHIDQTQPKSE